MIIDNMLFFVTLCKLLFFIPLTVGILDDDILYDIEWQADPASIDGSDNRLAVVSNRKEKFSCDLPTLKPTLSQKEKTVASADVQSFLTTLHSKKLCTYRFDQYWSYELCHGRHIRQYHETKVSGKKVVVQQYILGSFHSENQDVYTDTENGQYFQIDYKQFNERNVPMLAVHYTDGTNCDINSNRPRATVIYYICHDANTDGILHFHEVSSCVYEVIVSSPLLCKIAAFTPAQADRYSIFCLAEQKTVEKPKNLEKLEEESQRTMNSGSGAEFTINSADGSTFTVSYNYIDEPPTQDGRKKVKVEFNQQNEEKPTNNFAHDNFLHEFFAGKQCVTGGGGWWRYEFCYGKHVLQFHEDGEHRTSILLGTWNREKHLEWKKGQTKAKTHPNRPFISLFYGNGDFCRGTNQARNVEVKLKCSKREENLSLPSMYLVEPNTCSYILGIESPKFCALADFLDENEIPIVEKFSEKPIDQ